MAVRSVKATTWQRGVAEPAPEPAAWADVSNYTSDGNERSHYTVPDAGDKPTAHVSNDFGVSSLRTWPSLFNGTASGAIPKWWKPATEVDVLICGAGPFGLAVALSLARQGVSFRIIDKSDGPCHTGRADAVHPRALELLDAWGLADEIANEGPLLDKFTLFRNGVWMVNTYVVPTETSTKYRGNHIATQAQIERIYVRDLLRHQVLVERSTTLTSFEVDNVTGMVTAKLSSSEKEGETIKAKYLIGSDGASSKVREMISMPFEGMATDCFFVILDCELKTDYPHVLDTGWVVKAEQGCVIFVPRELGHTRVYIQLTGQKLADVTAAHKRNKERRNESSIGETQVYEHGLTPAEAMDELKKVMSPWTIDFAGPISWFAVWRVNERVARSFSTPDQRVHLGGDAAHVHSTLGAFGYNSTVYDAANLSWKLGLCIKGAADPTVLLPTYDSERRISSNRVIRYSGALLRFICGLNIPYPVLRGLDGDPEVHNEVVPDPTADTREAGQWLGSFFHGAPPLFMAGLGVSVVNTILSPDGKNDGSGSCLKLENGVRAPNPRVTLRTNHASYLYDALKGIDGRFHILVFGSDLQGPIRAKLAQFSANGLASGGFFVRFGGRTRFNIVLVAKVLPHEAPDLLAGDELKHLRDVATIVYDDRAPDEDAHYNYAVNHARGAVVVVRPDLAVGKSVWPEDTAGLSQYFASFLLEKELLN